MGLLVKNTAVTNSIYNPVHKILDSQQLTGFKNLITGFIHI